MWSSSGCRARITSNEAVHVVTFGFGDAGRADRDDIRLGAIGDIDHGLLDVVLAAQDGGRLVHGGRLQGNRFAEVAHEQYQAERCTALRTVHERHAAIHPMNASAPPIGWLIFSGLTVPP